jgi:peptide/nickel transport system substrate-binding protein
MAKHVISRRAFLSTAGLTAGAVALAACGATPTATPLPPTPTKPPAAPTAAPAAPTAAPAAPTATKPAAAATAAPTTAPAPTAAPTVKFKEAPMLADLVKANKLPALEQRLPQNPCVVTVVEKIGKYGGTWNQLLEAGIDATTMARTFGHDYILRYTRDWKTIVPNMVEAYQYSADNSSVTFKMRKGMKWSDGQPFTANDIMFWYEDILLNKDVTTAIPSQFNFKGKLVVVTKIDDYTVKFDFGAPYGYSVEEASGISGWPIVTLTPKHYLQKFHKKYNPDADALAKTLSFESWTKMFQAVAVAEGDYWYPDKPTTRAWRCVDPMSAKASQVNFERNAYFCKVDPEGNQLPYIDKIRMQVIADNETHVLKTLAGECDFYSRRGSPGSNNKQLFDDAAKKAGFHYYETISDSNNMYPMNLNLAFNGDAYKQKLFNTKDFRIALSIGLNRKEVLTVLNLGEGRIAQPAPLPGTKWYHEKLLTQYTEFDLKKANDMLDKLGLDKRDGEGWRLQPDGKRLTITWECNAGNQGQIDWLTMFCQLWQKDLRINMVCKPQERTLFYDRKASNLHEAAIWTGGGGLDPISELRWYMATTNEALWGVAWALWYLKDPKGIEPPDWCKQQYAILDELRASSDVNKYIELVKKYLDITAEQFPCWGIAQQTLPSLGIVKDNFKNVPDKIMDGRGFNAPGCIWVEQCYKDPA